MTDTALTLVLQSLTETQPYTTRVRRAGNAMGKTVRQAAVFNEELREATGYDVPSTHTNTPHI